MTITLDIRPEVQAELARQAALQGRAIESVATALLEGAVHPVSAAPQAPPPPEHLTGQALIDAFADIRGLLTDEEIDRMFSRNPSTARPVDLS
ncbi:MAG TPA: hypothetical protein VN924_12820 [Bryobacteraceae bacterium]|jgi:hypothetical protein|nr:hypothetical protein [Bryobacteraceae bacterium]